MVKVKVLRHMTGDKDYVPGDIRELSKEDADRLVATGAVELVKGSTKKEPATKNKSAAPANNKAN